MSRGTTGSVAPLLALSFSACSLAFGGDRYTGGAGTRDDAATDELDAALDAALDPTTDAAIDARASTGTDAPSPDAYATPCSEAVPCAEVGTYCDPTRSVCLPCDADRDGLPAAACARPGGVYDCDATGVVVHALDVRTDGRSLRAFLGTSDLHVFLGGAAVAHHVHVPAGGAPEVHLFGEGELPRADAIDAQRADDGLVIVAGYSRPDGMLRRYQLRDDLLTFHGERSLGALASFVDVTPRGPLALIRGIDTETLVGFSMTAGPDANRLLVDIGGGAPFVVGTRAQVLHPTASPAGALHQATGRDVALLSNDVDDNNPFHFWSGDVMRSFDTGVVEVGQLGITRLGGATVVMLGAVNIGGESGIRVATNVAHCPSYTDCTPELSGASFPLQMSGMTQQTVAVIDVSSTDALIATTAEDAFLFGNVRCTDDMCAASLPDDPVSTLRLAAPPLDATAVAVDVQGNPMSGRITIGVARIGPASTSGSSRLQVAQFDACFPASS